MVDGFEQLVSLSTELASSFIIAELVCDCIQLFEVQVIFEIALGFRLKILASHRALRLRYTDTFCALFGHAGLFAYIAAVAASLGLLAN